MSKTKELPDNVLDEDGNKIPPKQRTPSTIMPMPKFKVGDKVMIKGDDLKLVYEVLAVSIGEGNGERWFSYQVAIIRDINEEDDLENLPF